MVGITTLCHSHCTEGELVLMTDLGLVSLHSVLKQKLKYIIYILLHNYRTVLV